MYELEQIKKDEGFRAKAYQDHLGNFTIGHGITRLTREESAAVVAMKLERIDAQLSAMAHWYTQLPQDVRGVCQNMCYQLGVAGFFKFRKMIKFIMAGDYGQAAYQGMDSKWATQTPERAKRLMQRLLDAEEI